MKRTVASVLLSTLAWSAWAQSSGLAVTSEAWTSPRLQARVGINASQGSEGNTAAWQQQAGVVLGDYYFSRTRLGRGDVSSGFRATSGVLLGQRSMALGTPALATGQGLSLTVLRQARIAIPGVENATEGWSAVPYVGLGWSGISQRGGWGVSADFGFTARGTSYGGLRAGSGQSVDELLRELRLTPVLHLGVSYAF
jgi:hypothetical protein